MSINIQQGDTDLIINNINEFGAGFMKFYFIHFNIRSLRANFNSLLANLSGYTVVPDIIFLSEIWIGQNESSMYKVPGYNFFVCSNDDSRAGGVAAFVKKSIPVNDFNYNLITADCIKLEFSIGGVLMTTLCIYRYHYYSIENYLNEIVPILDAHRSTKNFLLIGDININILKSNTAIDTYTITMSSYGLCSLINVPTRIGNASSSCIDHAFYRFRSNRVSIIGDVASIQVTDHLPIILSVTIRSSVKQKTSRGRFYTRINYDDLNNQLQQQIWDEVFSTTSVNDSLDIFLDIFHSSLESCKFQKQINPSLNKLAPWMSVDLYRLINLKNRLSWKLTKHPMNSQLIARSKLINERCKRQIKREKAIYYRSIFKDCSKDSKKQWQIINSLVGDNSKAKVDICSILDAQGHLTTNHVDICNLFNLHFINSCSDLHNFHSTSYVIDTLWQNESFRFNEITPEELLVAISCLNNKESKGFDGLNSTILKLTALNTAYLISFIYNRSVMTGIFPNTLKYAKVIPLFKKDNRLLMTNYRPISKLSVLSKLFEKLIKTRMLSYLDSFHFLSECQYGFRSGRSTEHALLSFLTTIYESLNKGKLVGVMFLDISKAFDSVNHILLLNKLWRIGFRGFMYEWFKSYLLNRSQQVELGASISDFGEILSGVPQGSVLGPLLFLVYINSFFDLKLYGKVVAFADDLALTYCVDNLDELERQMNADLMISRNWFINHHMRLSDKSRGMVFNVGFRNFRDLNVYYHNYKCTPLTDCNNCLKLQFVNEFKYLGLIIDNKLNFKSHISKVKNYLNLVLKKLYLLRPICPLDVILKVYYGIFNSKLEYGLALYGGTYFSNIKPLIIAQKFAMRIIFNKKRTVHSLPLFQKSQVLPLRYLYIYKVLKLFFLRSGHNIVRVHLYNFRSKDPYSIPFTRKEYYRHFYLSRAPTFYKNIPTEIQNEPSLKRFCILLKEWLFLQTDIEKYFYVLE